MNSHLVELFKDKETIIRIQNRLPQLFWIANLECSRAGKIGMEVGSMREKIITALLIYKFGEANVGVNLSITNPEVDVLLFGEPISVKTETSQKINAVKLIWTVDHEKASKFLNSYYPSCDMLFAQIAWGKRGALYYIPSEAQCRLFDQVGKEGYIKLPKVGTNPRGVEVKGNIMSLLAISPETMSIPIDWEKTPGDYNPYEVYERWLEYWSRE